jgi:hypothetical protein
MQLNEILIKFANKKTEPYISGSEGYTFIGFVTYILKVSLNSIPFSVIFNPNMGTIFILKVKATTIIIFFICISPHTIYNRRLYNRYLNIYLFLNYIISSFEIYIPSTKISLYVIITLDITFRTSWFNKKIFFWRKLVTSIGFCFLFIGILDFIS